MGANTNSKYCLLLDGEIAGILRNEELFAVVAFDRVPDSLCKSEQPLCIVTGLLVVGIDCGEQHDWSRASERIQGCLQLERE